MSRSKRGAKPGGYEFWSRRPGKWHGGFGKYSRFITHKAERQEGKAHCQQGLEDLG